GFSFVEIAGGAAEVGAGGLLDAIRAGAEIDAVEVMAEDFVLRVAGLDAKGDGDLEELPVNGLGAHVFVGVARELHAEGGGSLGEIAVLDVSHGGAGEASDIDAVMFEKP